MNAKDAAIKELNSSYAIVIEGELAYQRQAMLNMFKKGAEWQQQKAIEAFNEAMIYFESPDCPTEEEALKFFVEKLDQTESGCSEKPNNWK